MKMIAILCGIIGMMITIQWDIETGKAFITGGVAGLWMEHLVRKLYLK